MRESMRLAAERGYCVSNVDATILAQRPKMAPYIDVMRERIAALLGVLPGCVGLKAKTM
jgi:2-C-methyl-D-erythritol 2,4-cyclodiphosphate synthase